jgi:pimeloyl-ACP methyl ester carboxylesterase
MAAPFFEPRPAPHEMQHCWLPAPYRQELAYRVSGSGRPVVLLHGLWNTSARWQHTMHHLSPHYRLYAPDLPGHGQTPPRLPWRLRDVAALLAAWMRLLALPPATLIGHSMGGALAIILAATEPQMINRLVLIDAAGLPMQRPFLRALTRAGLRVANRPTTRYTTRYSDTNRRPSLAFWQAADDILHCDLRPDLRAIHCPTLILWGTRDLLLPVQSAVALQRSIPGAELVMLPNVGHQPQRQVPIPFHHILADFLARPDPLEADAF